MILVFALILWIAPSLTRSFYPAIDINTKVNLGKMDILSLLLNNFAKNVPESIPALFIILSIGLIRIKINNKGKDEEEENSNSKKSYCYQPILNWNEILKSIDWNILFLFGGGLVLGLGIESSGLASLMGNLIAYSVGA